MKKVFAFIMLMVFLLTAVTYADVVNIKRVETITGRDGKTYIVDENSCTISDSENEYKFSVTESGSGQHIEITYPDGSTYWESGKDGHYSGGWSNDYIAFYSDNEKNYTPGDVLCDVYRSENPVRKPKNIVIIILGFLMGAFSLFIPEYAWYLHSGWRFRDVEPSDAAIIVERIFGVVIVLLVILYIFL